MKLFMQYLRQKWRVLAAFTLFARLSLAFFRDTLLLLGSLSAAFFFLFLSLTAFLLRNFRAAALFFSRFCIFRGFCRLFRFVRTQYFI